MTPGDHRKGRGEVAAVVMAGSGETVTYRELDDRSMQLARRLHAHGLRPGGRVAVMLENHPRYFETYWAALRSGLYVAPINWHLDAAETAAVVEDSGASVFITSAALADVARSLGARRLAGITLRLVMDGDLDGYTRYEEAIASQPARPLRDERAGEALFYSSGTTGRPRTIVPPLSGAAFGERPNVLASLFQARWGFGPDTVFLCAAPLYHAGPTGFASCVQRLGGTVVVMEEFDAAGALEAIEKHHVTHALFVPTHFLRLLELDEGERVRYDLSSLRVVVHGTGPCPVSVKEQMIDWWGKILHEYYSGSEGNAFTLVGPEDWLERKGTVGKLLTGALHIVDEDGNELPNGVPGQIWFETGAQFQYNNDPDSTSEAFNDRGWSSLGDSGYVDDDGWLYVVDRLAHVITSGGVTIYPQELENLLTMHPDVGDVAVIGVPDPDLGERVTAVVQVTDGVTACDELAEELLALCRERRDESTCPTSVEFVERLPRLPTGKLLKRELRRRYSLTP